MPFELPLAHPSRMSLAALDILEADADMVSWATGGFHRPMNAEALPGLGGRAVAVIPRELTEEQRVGASEGTFSLSFFLQQVTLHERDLSYRKVKGGPEIHEPHPSDIVVYLQEIFRDVIPVRSPGFYPERLCVPRFGKDLVESRGAWSPWSLWERHDVINEEGAFMGKLVIYTTDTLWTATAEQLQDDYPEVIP